MGAGDMTTVAGIDPGLDGAIALLSPDGLTIHDMPTLTVTTNGKQRRQLDLARLAWLFASFAPSVSGVCIEEPSAMPKDGVIQAFKFGFNCAVPQTLCAAFLLPVRLVRPNVWKAAFGLTGDKDASRRLAGQIMPRESHWWPLKKHDGRAEAALLALYGARCQ